MDLTIVFFGLILFASLSIVLYQRYALKLNLPSGAMMESELFVVLVGTIPFAIFVVSAFFYIKWYWVLLLVVVVSQLIGFMAQLFKSWLPLVALIIYLGAAILLFFILRN